MSDEAPDGAVDPNAVAAGWNPDDGPAPFEHGEFVEGLAAGESADDMITGATTGES